MSDAKSNAGKTSDKSDRKPINMLRLIGYGYLVVLLFLTAFFILLAEPARLNPSLGNPRWPLLIAGILVLPLLLPAFRYVAPYVKSVKISDIEVSFTQVEVVSPPLTALAEQLKIPAGQGSAPESAAMMTSLSSLIIDTIKDVQSTKDEILVVDLREGNA